MTSTGHRTDRDHPILAALSEIAAQADRARVGDATGATGAGVWWANKTRMTERDAHRKIRLAKALERHEQVGEALAGGTCWWSRRR